ncbi:nitrous oxide reductase accessory protein NosL [Flaviaesturariibacter amylovorans]|uniref:Copper chaperone NosL n=1 Tax=Flaviaesturariibacter amylovorans TaxID=1084520 RepID=A0ABP8H5V5_9BACT
MNAKMRPLSRLLIALAALSLTATYFLPVWFIYLTAPQYPEGLTMQIWLNKITGEVDIINGLNHYIGMKHISAEMFPEFRFLVYIMGGIIGLGLLVAATGRRKHLFAYLMLLAASAVAALYDFYRWGYDYGHNLDPKAAIQVPGLYYQPPVIGHKTLLNFDAYSYPDVGGWVVVTAGLLCGAVWAWERFFRRDGASRRQTVALPKPRVAALLAMAALLLTSCSVNPEPFLIGRDQCADCRMTIADARFGAELITRKGHIYKFDDIHCLQQFQKANEPAASEGRVFVADFKEPGKLMPAAAAFAVTGAEYKSPMNSNIACFSNAAAAGPAARPAFELIEKR